MVNLLSEDRRIVELAFVPYSCCSSTCDSSLVTIFEVLILYQLFVKDPSKLMRSVVVSQRDVEDFQTRHLSSIFDVQVAAEDHLNLLQPFLNRVVQEAGVSSSSSSCWPPNRTYKFMESLTESCGGLKDSLYKRSIISLPKNITRPCVDNVCVLPGFFNTEYLAYILVDICNKVKQILAE